MELGTKLLTLLAIFCVIASASVVCAADLSNDGSYAGSNYQDMNRASESQYYLNEENNDDANQKYLELENALSLENQTGYAPLNSTGNATDHATGNSTNHTDANATSNNTAPAVRNASNNAINSRSMLSTGNPILSVLGASILLGGYAILRRND